MLYFIFGEDSYRRSKRINEIIEKLSKESGFFLLSRIDAENFIKDGFEELTRGASLFGGNRAIVCENLLENENFSGFIMEKIPFCGESQNSFIFSESKPDAETIKIFRKNRAEMEEFPYLSPSEVKSWLKNEVKKEKISLPQNIEKNLVEESGKDLWLLASNLEKYNLESGTDSFSRPKSEKINIFKITDAVAEKDKGKSWLLFQKAILAGMDVEEIFWKILWQIKNLLIVKKLMPLEPKKIAEKANLHPYVAQKTAYAAKNFSENDLTRYSAELISLYHNSRRGRADFETGIEKFLIRF